MTLLVSCIQSNKNDLKLDFVRQIFINENILYEPNIVNNYKNLIIKYILFHFIFAILNII